MCLLSSIIILVGFNPVPLSIAFILTESGQQNRKVLLVARENLRVLLLGVVLSAGLIALGIFIRPSPCPA